MAFTVTINTADMRSFSTYMLALGSLLLLLFSGQALHAQGARLGVQGILKKSSGAALDDGNYSITFKLYNAEQGGTALWTETQTDVEVTSGIYTVALGSVTSLSLPFNEDYYLGVKVGSTPEMSPRAKLTIAPYALSLKGNSNLFPSTGAVGGGTVSPNSSYLLHLNNSSGAADERIEGTTGAQMTFKKGSAQYFLGLTSSDNKFRLNSGTSDMKFRYSGSDILTVLSGGISVTGSGIFSAGLTSSGGASTLNNIKLESSAISNTAATKFKHSGNVKLEINTDGVGVTGLLDLTGSKSYNTAYAFYANDGNLACASTGTASGSNNYSLSATSKIRAMEFNATSDRRIKKDIVPADNAADQEILRRLRVCDYKYIDFANYGTASKKGFIAQEVREVFPEAVTTSKDFIPDVFDRPSEYVVRDGRILLSMPDAHGLAEGDLVRLYSPDGQQDLSVMSVQDSHSFTLADWKGGRPEWVFVFGKQVDDFLQVDYDRIHTLNVSATRELVRQLETAEADARAVREEIGNNKSKIDQLELRMRAMEARISN
ncbi:MAG: hypothetical protein RL013_75 [Bacteroidota bacterium]